SGNVSIAAGAQSATITIDPNDDAEVEIDETVILTLGPGTGYIVDPLDNEATVTISSDDQYTASIQATDATASETGPESGEFTISLDAPNGTGAAITVNYT